jgi:PAS domain S-box-containing protein
MSAEELGRGPADVLTAGSGPAAAARRGEAVAVLAADMRRLIWATPAGASLFGLPVGSVGPAPLDARLPLERLLILAAGVAPTSGYHLERIRMPGRGYEAVTMAFRRIRLADGSPALVALSPEPTGPAPVLPAWIFDPEVERQSAAEPVLASDSSGPVSETSAPRAPAVLRGRPAEERRSVRITWRTDAEGRFLPFDPEAEAALGAAANIGGRRLHEVEGRLISDPSGAMVAALGWRETVTGADTFWRFDETHWRPVRVGGTPLQGPDGTFEGFRGFALLDPVRLIPIEGDAGLGIGSVPSAVVDQETAAPVGPISADSDEDRSRPVPRSEPPPRPGLTPEERSAFREIARALGSALKTAPQRPADEDAPRSIEPERPFVPSRVVAPAPPPPPAANEPVRMPDDGPNDLEHTPPLQDSGREELLGEALEVIDRLSLAVLISRGDVPILMNRALLDLLGYPDADVFHAEGGMHRLFRGPAPDESGNAVGVERRDGREIPVQVRMNAITWSGLPATLMSFRPAAADAALQRDPLAILQPEADRELAEMRAVLDIATDGVLVLEEDGRVASVNRTAEALFGYDAEKIRGETFLALLAPEDHNLALDYFEGLKSNGVASLLNDGREVKGRARRGGTIPLFMTLGRIGDGPHPRYCAVLRDMTAWKQAEADLLASKQQAEQASAQKSDILAKISHELRTPLSAIMGFAEVMIEERFGTVGNERYKEYLRDIHGSGTHLLSLVNDLLDLAKIEAGKFDLDFRAVDANAVVAGAVNLLQPQAQRGKVVLRSGLAATLPMIVADERSLRQIVLNLLSNAVKFTDPGGQVIVSTTLTEAGEVVIRVRDTGQGMDPDEIRAALEPFRQTRAGRKAGGTGLGLPLTKALVEANRAALDIRSARDQGTLVEVTFPTTRVLAD